MAEYSRKNKNQKPASDENKEKQHGEDKNHEPNQEKTLKDARHEYFLEIVKTKQNRKRKGGLHHEPLEKLSPKRKISKRSPDETQNFLNFFGLLTFLTYPHGAIFIENLIDRTEKKDEQVVKKFESFIKLAMNYLKHIETFLEVEPDQAIMNMKSNSNTIINIVQHLGKEFNFEMFEKTLLELQDEDQYEIFNILLRWACFPKHNTKIRLNMLEISMLKIMVHKTLSLNTKLNFRRKSKKFFCCLGQRLIVSIFLLVWLMLLLTFRIFWANC